MLGHRDAHEPKDCRRQVDHLGLARGARVSGQVRSSAGAPVAAARVHVTEEGGETYRTMARTDAQGAFALELDPGTYALQAVADGHAPSPAAAVRVGKGPLRQDLRLGGSARVRFSVTDDAGQDLPAKLIFMPTAPAPTPASHGEAAYLGGATRILYHLGGAGQVRLPPGSYTVTSSRGFEYEIQQDTLTLADGQQAQLQASLRRSVDTTGYLCGDFHVHAMWSFDASDTYALKVAAMVAEGLEIPVSSEHDHVADFNPTIAALGLQRYIQGVVGDEVSSGTWGHHNAFPITAAPGKPNAGAPAWYGKSPAQLFGELRAAWPGALLQVNHPRDTFGYFDKLGYDPRDGSFVYPDDWCADFDALEVFNNSDWQDNFDRSVRDWFSLLDRGQAYTITGNSDSHQVHTHEVGFPRNYVKLSTDSPAQLNLAELVRAVQRQQVVVSGGAFLTASVGGRGLGQVADATAGEVQVAVRVQAPTWVHLDRLRLYTGGKVGGRLAASLPLDSSTASPTNPAVRFDGKIRLTVQRDTWLVAVATGSRTMAPALRRDQPHLPGRGRQRPLRPAPVLLSPRAAPARSPRAGPGPPPAPRRRGALRGRGRR